MSILIGTQPLLRTQFDPAKNYGAATLTNTGLTATATSNPSYVLGTIGRFADKWYVEIEFTRLDVANGMKLGINTYFNGSNDFNIGAGVSMQPNGYAAYGGSLHNLGVAFATGETLGIAADFTLSRIWLAHENTWLASGDPAAGTNWVTTLLPNTIYFPGYEGIVTGVPGSVVGIGTVRGRSADMDFAPPTGFKPWEGF